jgi:hypothetical protein
VASGGRASPGLRKTLVAAGVGIDLELAAHRRAGAREAPIEDAVAGAVLEVALPDHDEVAVGIETHEGVVVDLELDQERCSGAREALREDAVREAILDPALPDDDEVAVGSPATDARRCRLVV